MKLFFERGSDIDMNKHIKIHMLTNCHDNWLNSKILGVILWNPKSWKNNKNNNIHKIFNIYATQLGKKPICS